ncbi:MAG TPA: glutamine-hydrolyzing GMP synthase, partial [Clostridia bacterium]|nr:glutamine-hydrolyzing GMP synthase [Clostridia bacterium]
MEKQTILILNFGGQYCQLIARRIRELNVYCEILPYDTPIEKIKAYKPMGMILSGGPASVHVDNAPVCQKEIFDLGIPVLGICYGMQLMTMMLGGKVKKAEAREYGKANVNLVDCALFSGLPKKTQCWMSHGDQVDSIPEGFKRIAYTDNCGIAGIMDASGKLYGVQFHPEVTHTPLGKEILRRFVIDICGCAGDWTIKSFIEESVENIRREVGSGSVLLALSGGVDSSVTAALLNRAVGDKLTCVFVDHGLLRKNEANEIIEYFSKKEGIRLIALDRRARFLDKLAGVT